MVLLASSHDAEDKTDFCLKHCIDPEANYPETDLDCLFDCDDFVGSFIDFLDNMIPHDHQEPDEPAEEEDPEEQPGEAGEAENVVSCDKCVVIDGKYDDYEECLFTCYDGPFIDPEDPDDFPPDDSDDGHPSGNAHV